MVYTSRPELITSPRIRVEQVSAAIRLAPGLPEVTTRHDFLPLLYPSAYPRQQYYFRYYVAAVLRASRAVIVELREP